MSYIRYDMKSSKVIVWSKRDHPSSEAKAIDSRNDI